VSAIKNSLQKAGIEFTLDNLGGRFVLYSDDVTSAFEILQRVAGIQSLSKAKNLTFTDQDDLIKQVKSLAQPLIGEKTFAVRVKRTGKHDFKSTDLEKDIGSVIDGNVNLRNPEIQINVEVREGKAFFYTGSIDGVGGFPAGSSGRVLCMFSGGIDSPVAAFQMMKRGCQVDFLFYNPIGEKYLNDVAKVYNFLISRYAHGYKPRMIVVDGKELSKQLDTVDDTYKQIAYKVLLYKVAKRICTLKKYKVIATGEALSQKSTQTMDGLLFIDRMVDLPTFRPLLTMDKVEIVKIARKLGTLALSERVPEYCNISEGPVVTKPNDEGKIPEFDVESIFDVIEGEIELDADADKVPELNNIVTMDVRPGYLQKQSDLKTDLVVPFDQAFDYEYDKDKSYVLVCDYGGLSEDLALTLRKKGIKAAGVTIQAYFKYFAKTPIEA
jgi:thiamine biosynthesis protein ThiI